MGSASTPIWQLRLTLRKIIRRPIPRHLSQVITIRLSPSIDLVQKLGRDHDMDTLKLLFDRADALNGYWNLYIAVALGVLGLMASGKSFAHLRQTKALLTIAFVVFALSNLEVLIATNEQRRAIAALIDPAYRAAAQHAGPPEN